MSFQINEFFSLKLGQGMVSYNQITGIGVEEMYNDKIPTGSRSEAERRKKTLQLTCLYDHFHPTVCSNYFST